MFGYKKRLKEIEDARQLLEKEKSELLFIKQQLEDSTPKIDISNVYVWENNGIYSIVYLKVQSIRGRTWGGIGVESDGFYSALIDIFTNKIIYEKRSVEKISSTQFIPVSSTDLKMSTHGYYAYLYPICEIDKNLIAFVDKKVPLYILQQLLYELNNIDVDSLVLRRTTKK